MTREELGITAEGEAYINAIIARGEIEDRLRHPYYTCDERDVPRLREELAQAQREVDRADEAVRNSPEWVARYGRS
jgi:regulator of protease activity HflC (stomatin/prohibitin superfamily)